MKSESNRAVGGRYPEPGSTDNLINDAPSAFALAGCLGEVIAELISRVTVGDATASQALESVKSAGERVFVSSDEDHLR